MPIVELYDDGRIAGLSRRIKGWTWVLCALSAAALAVCVTLAALAGTANADRMELTAIAVSTLTGWVVIYCATFVVTEGRRELGHARMLREEARERVEGEVTVTREKLIIRGSIRVRRVEVRAAGETRRFLVCESRAGALSAAKARALYIANGYVAAYEVAP